MKTWETQPSSNHWRFVSYKARNNIMIMFCFLQVELKRLEDLSESIVQDFNYMRQREVGGDDGLDGMIS